MAIGEWHVGKRFSTRYVPLAKNQIARGQSPIANSYGTGTANGFPFSTI